MTYPVRTAMFSNYTYVFSSYFGYQLGPYKENVLNRRMPRSYRPAAGGWVFREHDLEENCVKLCQKICLKMIGLCWQKMKRCFCLGCIFQRHFRFMVFHDFPACFMKVTWLHCKPLDRRFVLGAVRLLGGYLDDHPTNQSKWKWIMYNNSYG